MKKGFTLIELLAVIVILAIIALIATPIILGVVENARKSVAGSSALGYLDAVEKEIALDGLNDIIYPTGDIDILTSDYYKTIEVQGEKPSKGNLVVSDRYLITSATLCVNNYKVELTGHKIKSITKDGCEDMKTPLPPEPPVEDKKPKFSGVEDTEVQQWTEFDPKASVTATDSEGNDITGRIEIDRGDFTTAIADTYILTYSVSDEEGNEATAERKITVISSEYIDNSGAASPNLKGNLIPVTIDDDGTVHKADITSRWYDYDEKKWANAVILNGEDTKDPGDEINEDEIKAYFVWVPKYRYKLFNVEKYTSLNSSVSSTSSAQSIDIEFNLENTIDGDDTCKTPMISGETGTCVKDKWMTHPAFISFNVNGFWVAKFETSGTDSEILIKPNQTTKYEDTIDTMFEKAYNYNRSLESHMIKNTEWGAVTYLAHSKYGINKAVGFNNYRTAARSGQVKTGCGAEDTASASTTCEAYNTTKGKLASTTGNITGAYDMNGGAFEIAAAIVLGNPGVYLKDSNKIASYDAKYYDLYDKSLSSSANFSGRILGDATGEIGPFGTNYQYDSWYKSKCWFISESAIFFRGGAATADGDSLSNVRGMFSFWYPYGSGFPWFSYRIVLGF